MRSVPHRHGSNLGRKTAEVYAARSRFGSDSAYLEALTERLDDLCEEHGIAKPRFEERRCETCNSILAKDNFTDRCWTHRIKDRSIEAELAGLRPGLA